MRDSSEPNPPKTMRPDDISAVQNLRKDPEPLPDWLATYREGAPLPIGDILRSRIVYYPGSADDGHPLRLFSPAHAAHCFLFSDLHLPPETFMEHLADDHDRGHPRGYRTIEARHLREEEIRPDGWRSHISPPSNYPARRHAGRPAPFGLWAVFEREPDLTDEHGPERLAIMVIGGEAVATYDALFCQGDAALVYAVVLQDHGFGGNWERFGGEGSPLFSLAGRFGLPEWLLVGDGGEDSRISACAWPGYKPVSKPSEGGMHFNKRRLYRKSS